MHLIRTRTGLRVLPSSLSISQFYQLCHRSAVTDSVASRLLDNFYPSTRASSLWVYYTLKLTTRIMHSPDPTNSTVDIWQENNVDATDTTPASPASLDAVTASEGGGDVSELDDSDGKTYNSGARLWNWTKPSKDGTNGLGDIVSSHPELGLELSDFLEKIAHWKGIMPEPLVKNMEHLKDIAAKMKQEATQLPEESVE